MLSTSSFTRVASGSNVGTTTIVHMLSGMPSFNSSLGKIVGFKDLHTIQFTTFTAISEEGMSTAMAANIQKRSSCNDIVRIEYCTAMSTKSSVIKPIEPR